MANRTVALTVEQMAALQDWLLDAEDEGDEDLTCAARLIRNADRIEITGNKTDITLALGEMEI